MDLLKPVIPLLALMLYGIVFNEVFVDSQANQNNNLRNGTVNNQNLMESLIDKYQHFLLKEVKNSSNGTFCCFEVPSKMADFTCSNCRVYGLNNLTQIATPFTSCAGDSCLALSQLKLYGSVTANCTCSRSFFIRTISANLSFQVPFIDIISETQLNFGCQENSTLSKMEVSSTGQMTTNVSGCDNSTCSLVNIFLILYPDSFTPVFQQALDLYWMNMLQTQMNKVPFIYLPQWITSNN
ncbi:uncharacterized protein LOC143244821 [Tachypleus tridentatus]|uniref:uncharacterized protein LOC143244821 n=1 Tax=Tachypleus tridentatus TaxID=6853 RepID=UPI003FD4940E